VREGVFLEQLLKNNKLTFPPSENPSVRSILDRFKPLITIEKKRKVKLDLALKLYNTVQKEIRDDNQYTKELLWALKLSNIGKTLTIYKTHQHAFYIAMQELNYGFTHKESLLIAVLLRMHGKELIHKPLYEKYQTLLIITIIHTILTTPAKAIMITTQPGFGFMMHRTLVNQW